MRRAGEKLDGRYGDEAVLTLVSAIERAGAKTSDFICHSTAGLTRLPGATQSKFNVGERNIEQAWAMIDRYGFPDRRHRRRRRRCRGMSASTCAPASWTCGAALGQGHREGQLMCALRSLSSMISPWCASTDRVAGESRHRGHHHRQRPLFAWPKLQADWPDVIVLDVEMPRMDGISFLRKLMAERPTPVVMCSTLTEAGCETTLQALAAGAVSFVTKPKIGLRNFLRTPATASSRP